MEISTYSGQYHLNTPGPGNRIPFQEDVHLRLQKYSVPCDESRWLDIEHELRGITRRITKDGTHYRMDKSIQPNPLIASYPIQQPFVQESRASYPAWELRDMDNGYKRFEELWLNPQNLHHLETNFPTNISTKQEARDSYQQ